MPTVDLPTSGTTRAVQFIRDYCNAPNDAEIEVRPALLGGQPALVLLFQNTIHGFTIPEARRIADIAEDTMREYFGYDEVDGLQNLILILRACADRVDREGVGNIDARIN